MASSISVQLQIFKQLYLIELLRAFNRSRASEAISFDIPKAFDRVWHTGLFHKLKSYGVSGWGFGFILPFLGS